ncbi:MAG: sugar phosphate isomerase/epimerase [Candidatus Bathyarchaeia archaeon]
MAKPKVGAQLIIWGKRIDTDLLGVLDEVAELGYAGVEMSPAQLEKYSDPRALFSSRNLSLIGLHMGVGDLKLVDAALKLLRRAEGHYLLFSGAGGRGNTEQEYRQNSRFLQDVGKRAKEYGVRVCYHNHAQEIINNAMGMKIVCEETDPELVSLCVDTFWFQYGGLSPVEFIKENLDRVAYLHLKDMRDREFVELGQGVIDFPAVIKAVKPIALEWAVVEQDRTKRTPKESMEISRRYLKEKLGL